MVVILVPMTQREGIVQISFMLEQYIDKLGIRKKKKKQLLVLLIISFNNDNVLIEFSKL